MKIRSGLAIVLAALFCTLFVLHGCQEPPEGSDASPAAAAAASDVLLTITGTGTGTGVVTSSPAGVDCTITAGRTSTTGCAARFASEISSG